MILIQQQYVSSDPARQAELELARAINASCRVFTQVVPVDGGQRRWTFADLFHLAASDFAGRTCVIANSDISFDESLALADGCCDGPPTLLALTRWDDDVAPSMEGRVEQTTWRFYSQSQDAWVFRAGTLPAFQADFRLGVPRCENRLAFEAARAGVVVRDPALSIRIRHHHATNLRTWKQSDHYRGPLLFPRLTTATENAADGLVLHRAFRKHEVVVPLGDGRLVDAAVTAPVQWSALCRARIGVRSPFYVRRREYAA